jgi:predicted NBD/HSP70 family sugar kinase
MDAPVLKVAQGILLHGSAETGRYLRRPKLFKALDDLPLSTFRSAGEQLGAIQSDPGLGFFDLSVQGKIAFGPGAGLVVGISVGAESVRALLVDANGWEYCPTESDALENQTAAEPGVLLSRIKSTVAQVLAEASKRSNLMVDGGLPLLGWAVAWPTAIDRDGKPSDYALSHPSWSNGQALGQRVQLELGIPDMPTYALNDAHAAAIAIAHYETHRQRRTPWLIPHLTLVLRLAGNISGAVIVLEPPKGETSGFLNSILLGGVDNHAGAIGHAPIALETVASLNAVRNAGLAEERAGELADLTPQACSCMPPDDGVRHHLEAYASVFALTKRVYGESRSRHDALTAILQAPVEERHAAALRDVGALVGEALLGPIAVLNPAMIKISGSLALATVSEEIENRIRNAHQLGTQPEISTIKGRVNDFIRAKGAALAMIRNDVHREFPNLLGGDKDETATRVGDLTQNLKPSALPKR